MENIKLVDLINKEALQKIQDGFSKYTGMAALTVDVDGVPITKASGFARFCNELTRKSDIGCKKCEECDRDGAIRTMENGKAVAYVCHAGLMDFAAPIIVEDKVVGGVIGGQVRIRDIDRADIMAKAMEYGIDPDEYVKACNETSLLTRENVEKAASFLEEIASGLSSMAYQSYLELKESKRMERVAKSQAEYVMNMSMHLEHVLDRWTRVVDNTIRKTTDGEVYSLLSTVQQDVVTVKTSIKDTINYIKMSASDVEIGETEYTISQLVELLKESVDENVTVNTSLVEHEKLFGDIVRIGQMFNKIIREVSSRKEEGTIEVLVSTKVQHYATFLKVAIIDRNTKYDDPDIQRVRELFVENKREDIDYSDKREMWLSFEGMLLKDMSGNLVINKLGDDCVMEIVIPQVGL